MKPGKGISGVKSPVMWKGLLSEKNAITCTGLGQRFVEVGSWGIISTGCKLSGGHGGGKEAVANNAEHHFPRVGESPHQHFHVPQ